MTWKFQNQPLVSIFAFVGCGGGEDANTDEPKGSAKTETTYGIGDTWEVVGFNNAGNSFTLYINTYDGNGNEQKATFKIEY